MKEQYIIHVYITDTLLLYYWSESERIWRQQKWYSVETGNNFRGWHLRHQVTQLVSNQWQLNENIWLKSIIHTNAFIW